VTVDQRITIVGMGDSTTAGTPGWLSRIEAPPEGSGDETSQYAYWLMQTRPEWRVLNHGVNGERSDQIRGRFERDVVEHAPRAVVIIAGVNDVYQGREPQHVIEQLVAMYERATRVEIRVVAGTIVPYNTATEAQNAAMRTINDWIRRFATDTRDIDFADTRAAVADPGNPDRLADSPDDLHPSSKGYREMAGAIEPALRRLLK
jgi:lysophospholipase L1-like esterase